MSNSTTLVDQVSQSQAQKEVTVNAYFDAVSQAAMFGRRASTTTGLTWGFYGGIMNISGTPTAIANGTVALTASTTNYVYITSSGVMTVTTSIPGSWPGPLAASATAIYTVVTNSVGVTSYTDWRIGVATPIASGAVTTVSNSDGTLTISPTSGAVVASLALGHANTWTAKQTFRASSTSAATAGIYLQSGTLMTTAEVGGVEFLTDKAYFTITTGAARKEFTLNDAALTSGRLPYITTNGRITSQAGYNFDGTNLWGFATASPGLNATAGRSYVTVKGTGTGATAASGNVQLADNCSVDAAANTIGNIEWHNSSNTSGNTRCAYVSVTTEGATANSRGAFLSIATRVNNSASATERLRIDSNGSNILGGSGSALATTATDGFAYIPSCAGPPTGVPTAYTGRIALVVDSTNNKMYIYSGGNWVALN